MSKHFPRAERDFVLVRLPRYLRAFAIFLLFASPVLATAYFFPTLDHFNKAMYHIPSFALLGLSAIIFYRLRWYFLLAQHQEIEGGAYLLELPWHVSILVGVAIELLFFGGIFFQALYKQTALRRGFV